MLPDKILGIFYMYGLMIAVGILACFGLLFFCGKRNKVEERFLDFVFYNAIVAIALGFLAAALFQGFYDYIENPEAGFHPFNGGITFIGGLIGGIISFLGGYFIFRKKFKGRLTDIISFVPCCILIAHGFGRVGCFFAGCCYGKPTDSFLGVQFPGMSGKVHPTQLYEAIFLFALCAVLFLLFWKKNYKYNLSLYLFFYGIFRFFIEFLRDDHRGELVGSISPSQFWSIAMVLSSVAVGFLLKWAHQKRAEELAVLPEASETQTENESREADETDEPIVSTMMENEQLQGENATPTENTEAEE